jgi:hypothetical protein
VDSLSSRVRAVLAAESDEQPRSGVDGGALGTPAGFMVGWPLGGAVHAVAQQIARLPTFATAKDVQQVRFFSPP